MRITFAALHIVIVFKNIKNLLKIVCSLMKKKTEEPIHYKLCRTSFLQCLYLNNPQRERFVRTFYLKQYKLCLDGKRLTRLSSAAVDTKPTAARL